MPTSLTPAQQQLVQKARIKHGTDDLVLILRPSHPDLCVPRLEATKGAPEELLEPLSQNGPPKEGPFSVLVIKFEHRDGTPPGMMVTTGWRTEVPLTFH